LPSDGSAVLPIHLLVASLVALFTLSLSEGRFQQTYASVALVGLGIGAGSLALLAGRVALGVFLAQLFANMRETLLSQLNRHVKRLEATLEQIAQEGYEELAERAATVYQLGLTYIPGSEVSSESLETVKTHFFDWAYAQATDLAAKGQRFSFGQAKETEGFARFLYDAHYAAIEIRQVLVRLSVNSRQSRCLDSFGPRLLLLSLVAILGFTLPIVTEIVLLSGVPSSVALAVIAGASYLLAVGIVHLLVDSVGAFVIARVPEIGTKIASEQVEALVDD